MPTIDDIIFTPVSNLMFDLFLRGAKKIFSLEYSGVSTASARYGGNSVGPEVWRSKNADYVLMAFKGTNNYEIAILESDPEFDADPVPGFMKRYGDDVLDDMVTRVNYQKIVAGDDWAEDAVIVVGGGGGIFPEPEDGFTSFMDSLLWDLEWSSLKFRPALGNLPARYLYNIHELGENEPALFKDWQLSNSPLESARPVSMKIFFESIDFHDNPEPGTEDMVEIETEYGFTIYSGPIVSGQEIFLTWETTGADVPVTKIAFNLYVQRLAIITEVRFNDTNATSFAFLPPQE